MNQLLALTRIHQDEGATAAEYAIMAGFIAAVIAATVGLFGQAVVGLFSRVPLSVFGG